MRQHSKLLVVIADGEHARLVRPAANHALATERQMDSATAHQRSAQLGADRPGASFHSGSTAHHAVAPRDDPHDLAKERFADEVAAAINAASDTFDALVLVAPAHSLSRIRDGLDGTAAARLVGTLAKDLVKTPDGALQPHLQDWVPPVHRRT